MNHAETRIQDPPTSRLSRRLVMSQIAATAALAAVKGAKPVVARENALTLSQATSSPQAGSTPVAGNPASTVVLVHGAWADGSGWADVIAALDAAGVPVVAVANPLRSLSGDSAYVASIVGQIPSPVLLVGHSYGGAVITNAAAQARNVAGLVYVAAFIPDEGETLLALAGQATDSLLGPALRPMSYPVGTSGNSGTEYIIDRASFQAVFCADLPNGEAAVLAATQRPTADLAFSEPTGNPAWKTLPSWAVVSTADKAIGVTGLRLMAQRAGATTTEVDASHAVMLSQPAAVTEVIRTALAGMG